jgi:2-methylcitrate dehydratase PrpD
MTDAIVPLAEHVVAARFEDVPAEAVAATKRLLLDGVAVAIAGATAPACREVVDLICDWGGKAEATIALDGRKVPHHQAVLANVMMAHALELDDLYDEAIAHASTPAIWSALAAAELKGGASGQDTLFAMMLGADLMCRMARAADRTFELGYHKALLAGFAATAATGRLLGLDAATLANAFGITFTRAGATVQALPDGALVKRLQPAMNASDGMRAVAFARAGVTGVRNVLEGPFGFYRLFNHKALDRDLLLHDLGARWLGAEASIKRYPSSRCTHGPIQAALELRRAHGLEPEAIESVEVAVCEACRRVAGAPFAETRGSPQVDCQFNIAYAVAAALLWGDVFVAEVQERAATDPRARALAARINVVAEPAHGDRMAFAPVSIVVRTRDGRALARRLDAIKGSPADPMSWDEIVAERLDRCLALAPSPLPRDAIIEAVARFDELPDARELIRLLSC